MLTPFHFETLCCPDGLLFTFRHDCDEISALENLDQARNIRHRTLVHRNELCAYAGRAYQAPMQHPGQAQVLDKAGLAANLARNIRTRAGGADNGIAAGILQQDVLRNFLVEGLAAHQFGVADFKFRMLDKRDHTILDS